MGKGFERGVDTRKPIWLADPAVYGISYRLADEKWKFGKRSLCGAIDGWVSGEAIDEIQGPAHLNKPCCRMAIAIPAVFRINS